MHLSVGVAGVGDGPDEVVFPPIMRGGKYKVLEGIELFWTGLRPKDGLDFGGVVQTIRGETD
jgi:hypothetical protein